MAVYRLSVSVISRGGARSALASAAYRAAERLVELGRDAITSAAGAAAYRAGAELAGDEGQAFDFSAKRGVVHSEIVLPEGAPVWMADRERLWNAVEASEKRKDARLARETQLALPRELDREAQVELVRGFVAEQMVARGMVADFAVHDVKARDGGRQPHAHVMTTTRAIDPARPLGFGGKVRAWDDRAVLLEWREAWAGHVNAALERARTPERVDHRTLEAQRLEAAAAGDFERAAELDREPEPKVGFRAWALEREGVATERGEMLRSVRERNAERRAIYAEVAEAGERAKALFLEARQRAGDAFEAFESWARTAYVKVREWVMDVADGLHGLAHGGRPDELALRPDLGERHPGYGEAGREDAREQKPDGPEIGATAGDRPRPEPDESRADGRAGRDGERVSLRERLAEAMRERSRANRERARELGRGRDTGLSR